MGHTTIISKLTRQLKKLDLELDSYINTISDMGCRCIVLRLKDQRMPPIRFEYWSGTLKHKLVLLNIMLEISMTAKSTAKKCIESGANRDVVDYYDGIAEKINNAYNLNYLR